MASEPWGHAAGKNQIKALLAILRWMQSFDVETVEIHVHYPQRTGIPS
jgi:hypothetical protein